MVLQNPARADFQPLIVDTCFFMKANSERTDAATEQARKSCEPFARLEASRKAAIETIDYDAEREEAMNEKFGIID